MPISRHPPLVHDHHLVRQLGDDADIVGDEQHGVAEFLLQVPYERQDLRLDGHVEGRGRLVADQYLGVAYERHGDHHALSHAPGELERIHADAPVDVVDPDPLEHLRGFLPRLFAADLAMAEDGLRDLVAHRVDRRQGGHRLLEDHADETAAQFLKPRIALAEGGDLERIHAHRREVDGAAHDPPGRLDQAHDAIGRHRFAGPGLADDGGDLAARHVEAHVHQGMGGTQVRLEVDREIADLENRVRHFAPAVL